MIWLCIQEGLFLSTLRGPRVTTVRVPKKRARKNVQQQKWFHQITDRNRQVGSKDSALLIRAIKKVWN